jgi:hypothetical protein
MNITEILITKYGFQELQYKDGLDKWSCCRRIHILHWLFYSENDKHFTLAVKNESMKGKAGGGYDPWIKVMIPRPIYNENDVIELLTGLNVKL